VTNGYLWYHISSTRLDTVSQPIGPILYGPSETMTVASPNPFYSLYEDSDFRCSMANLHISFPAVTQSPVTLSPSFSMILLRNLKT